MPPEPEAEIRVLVVQAESIGAVAVIRSLGRAGFSVFAMSTDADALGGKSAFAKRFDQCPAYSRPEFLGWFRNYLSAHRIRVVIPSEGLLLALRPVFAEFASLLPFAGDGERVFAAMSKFDLFDQLKSHSGAAAGHLPPTVLVRDLRAPPPIDRETLGPGPYFIKLDGCYATAGQGGLVLKADSPDEVRLKLRELASSYSRAVVQAFVEGQGVGVFFLRTPQGIVAEFMHRRLHEVPHTGGVSGLRESWDHPAMRADAEAKLLALDWYGVAMFEYRWNPVDGRFALMELNARFWGSLHLALYAGIDFPRLLVESWLGRPVAIARGGTPGVRSRHTFPLEVQHVWSKLKDPSVSMMDRIRTVFRFVALSMDLSVRADLWFPGDRRLYFANLGAFVKSIREARRTKSDAANSRRPGPSVA